MRFVNVTDETYDKLKRASEETGKTIPEVIDDIIEDFGVFGIQCAMQQELLNIAADIMKRDIEEER